VMYVEITGAAGGFDTAGYASRPGYGARVQGYYRVAPGTVIHVVVGCAGSNRPGNSNYGGYNGGGDGTIDATGGGGGTDIRLGGIELKHRIIIAGGGAGIFRSDQCGILKGGDGGQFGVAGQNGASSNCAGNNLQTGGGGTWTSGGVAGAQICSPLPQPGSLGRGGNGCNFGGGGGGGYYGGRGVLYHC
jgi:hypothetical protein